jgi:hypothetical protein
VKEYLTLVEKSCVYQPGFTPPEEKIHGDCTEEQIFAPNLKVLAIPYVLESAH